MYNQTLWRNFMWVLSQFGTLRSKKRINWLLFSVKLPTIVTFLPEKYSIQPLRACIRHCNFYGEIRCKSNIFIKVTASHNTVFVKYSLFNCFWSIGYLIYNREEVLYGCLTQRMLTETWEIMNLEFKNCLRVIWNLQHQIVAVENKKRKFLYVLRHFS